MQTRYTGGTVLHLYMNERLSSPEACKRLVRTALSRFRLPYITVTPTFSICPVHGYLAGEHAFCPTCDAERLAAKRAAATVSAAPVPAGAAAVPPHPGPAAVPAP